jgi:hypothetical protein
VAKRGKDNIAMEKKKAAKRRQNEVAKPKEGTQ